MATAGGACPPCSGGPPPPRCRTPSRAAAVAYRRLSGLGPRLFPGRLLCPRWGGRRHGGREQRQYADGRGGGSGDLAVARFHRLSRLLVSGCRVVVEGSRRADRCRLEPTDCTSRAKSRGGALAGAVLGGRRARCGPGRRIPAGDRQHLVDRRGGLSRSPLGGSAATCFRSGSPTRRRPRRSGSGHVWLRLRVRRRPAGAWRA